MKRFLKALRSNQMINQVIRFILRSLFAGAKRMIHRWPVHGIVKVGVGKSTFYMKSLEDEPIANNLFYFGPEPEQKVIDMFVFNLCDKIEIMFDVGANVGYYSLLAATASQKLRIYSYEPHPINFQRFKENLTLNKVETVLGMEMALGESSDDLKFYVARNKISVAASSIRQQTLYFESDIVEIAVSQSTLDNCVKELKIIPQFVKIDVELFEREVLRGGAVLFNQHDPIILIEVHNINLKLDKLNLPLAEFQSYVSDIENLLIGYGYHFYAIYGFGIYRMDSILHHPEVKNIICAKIKSSKRYYSPNQIDSIVNELLPTAS